MHNSSLPPQLMAVSAEESIASGVRRSASGDGARVEAAARVSEVWTWIVIFTTATLCWMPLAVFLSLSIG
jgi:hypothetical protein